ncbi:MAG: hypothetical protein M3450_08145 [Actinomycetota bacterium]|nr:hypothetical protein [Actinomycetota bacterium]
MIVVDNGSTDGVVDEVRHAVPAVEVIAPGRNLGATARTLGVARASTPYVGFSLGFVAARIEGRPSEGSRSGTEPPRHLCFDEDILGPSDV